MIECYKTKNFLLEYNEKTKILHQTWVGFMKLEDFKRCCDEIFNACRDYDVIAYISDSTKQSIVPQGGVEYAARLSPKVKEFGVLFETHVIPENLFAELSVDKYYEDEAVNGGVANKFVSVEQAEKWILEKYQESEA